MSIFDFCTLFFSKGFRIINIIIKSSGAKEQNGGQNDSDC